MTCKASKRSTHANGRPSLALKAKVEVGTVLYLVPDGIWIPPDAVDQLMAIAFRHGASYVLENPVTWDEQPILPVVKWPRDTLIAKPAMRELMETAFLYGAVHALQQRAAWNAPAADRMG